MLIDYCGRGVVIQPTKKELDHPYIGPKLSEALRGAEISAVDRNRIFRQISERFLTEWGNRHEMFEKFNGTPLYLINLLTMQRTEYQVDGPLTELARQVLVLPWVTAKCQREALAPGSFGAQVYEAVDTGESPQTKRRCWSAPSCRRDSTPPSAGYRRTRQHTVEAEKASRYVSVRYQPNYARAQDVRDGYIADEMEGRKKIAAI